jgi:hypothetical protein
LKITSPEEKRKHDSNTLPCQVDISFFRSLLALLNPHLQSYPQLQGFLFRQGQFRIILVRRPPLTTKLPL